MAFQPWVSSRFARSIRTPRIVESNGSVRSRIRFTLRTPPVSGAVDKQDPTELFASFSITRSARPIVTAPLMIHHGGRRRARSPSDPGQTGPCLSAGRVQHLSAGRRPRHGDRAAIGALRDRGLRVRRGVVEAVTHFATVFEEDPHDGITSGRRFWRGPYSVDKEFAKVVWDVTWEVVTTYPPRGVTLK